LIRNRLGERIPAAGATGGFRCGTSSRRWCERAAGFSLAPPGIRIAMFALAITKRA